jgi:hypothetical protein
MILIYATTWALIVIHVFLKRRDVMRCTECQCAADIIAATGILMTVQMVWCPFGFTEVRPPRSGGINPSVTRTLSIVPALIGSSVDAQCEAIGSATGMMVAEISCPITCGPKIGLGERQLPEYFQLQ